MKPATAFAVAVATTVCFFPLGACHLLLPFGRTADASRSADAGSDGGARRDSHRDLTPAERTWKTVAATSPMGRVMGAKMTYCGGILLFGGRDEQQLVSGVWELGADNRWTEKDKSVLTRYAPAVVCDEQLGALLVFGGRDAWGTAQNDLWRWDASSSWRQINNPAPPGPSARFAAFSAYDGLRHRTVVFGGISSGATTDELWELDSQSWTWTRVTASGSWPLARHSEGSSAVFVSDANAPAQLRNRFVIVGGTREVSSTSPLVLGDTWAWDGKSWTELCPTCLNPARSHAAVAYDPRNRELLSIGGWTGKELDGTWRWVATDWQKIAELPPARDTASMAYDPSLDRIVLFGGNGIPCEEPTGQNCGDTWVFQ